MSVSSRLRPRRDSATRARLLRRSLVGGAGLLVGLLVGWTAGLLRAPQPPGSPT